MSDLADRISRAAVAALDLAPFDDRFGRLSRLVLAGGASRFAKVTTDDQAIHFVIPVGMTGERLTYGALVLQDRQAGIVWKDAAGTDHSTVVPRGDATRTTFSSLTLAEEQWMRFDVDGSDEQLSFLVPPVSSPLLRSTLIDFFRARPGTHRPSAVIPQVDPEPAPVVRFPDPEPEPLAEFEPLPEPEPAASDLDATQVLPAADIPEPALEPGGDPVPSEVSPAEQFAAEPALLNEWAPEAMAAEPLQAEPTEVDDATRIRPVPPVDDDATRVHEPPFDLYRDQPAAPPETPPAWTQQPTQAIPTPSPTPQAAPQPEASPWAYQSPAPEGRQPASAQVGTVEASHAQLQPSGASRTLVGFLLGLLGTLAIGGAFIIAKLLGA